MFQKKEEKLLLIFFDDKKALELYYKSHYVTNTLGRSLNASENGLLAPHHIALFSGEDNVDIHYNTLYIFPNASKDNPNVGKYVKTKEFNPNVK